MMKRVFASAMLSVSVLLCSAQLVLNEVSQGSTGNREYVEFVITGVPTCTDSCFDLRNWIIDDNNGFHAQGSGTGIAQGCIRFRNIAQWACVPYGSIILVYNDQEKNASITLADDPSDANKDKVYIIPANSTVLEGNAFFPSVPNGSSYSGFTFTSPAQWSYVEMGNSNDAFHSVSPSNLTVAAHSVGWGNNTQNINIYFAGAAGGKVFFNANSSNTDYNLQANWTSANVAGNETPGLPNNTANNNWIQSLRNQAATNIPVFTNRSVCILNGQSFFAGGANQTTSGVYKDTLVSSRGCDSVLTTNLRVSSPVTFPINPAPACDSFVYQGFVFKNDTTVRDTLRTSLGCDSVYRVANILIKRSKRDTTTACINPGGNYFAGGANQTNPGFYNDTYTAANGCDSVVTTHLLLITQQTQNQTLQSCSSVTLFGTKYTSSTTVRDTLRSAQKCDSIYRVYNIVIANVLRDTIRVCINQGGSYFAGGANQTSSGFYSDTFQTSTNGCDSIRVVNLKVQNPLQQQQNVSGCNSYVFKGITYTNSTSVKDTVKSSLGCDSVYITINITVSQTQNTSVDVCINNGESYFAGGANQTTSGSYQDIYTSNQGCDSIVTTNLSVITITRGVADFIGCNSVTFRGLTYTQSTTIADTTRNTAGCIASILLNSIVIKSSSYDTVWACINPGESYFAGGANQTTSGTFYDTIPQTSTTCSIFRTTKLQLIIPTVLNLPAITANNQLVFGGVLYTESDTVQTTTLSALGCDSVIQNQPIVIIKLAQGIIFMPNAFSPNGDGNNDIIEPIHNETASILSFKIFNRWGELVYSGTKGWDGYYKGALQKPDSFVYVLKGMDNANQKPIHLQGSLILIR